MAGIVATLKTHDDVGLLRQPVDNLAFSFVAPLGADHNDIPHPQLFPLQLSEVQHDLFEKTGFSPVEGMPGPVPCEAHIRIKDAGYRRKQEGAPGLSGEPIKPLISPENPSSAADGHHSARPPPRMRPSSPYFAMAAGAWRRCIGWR